MRSGSQSSIHRKFVQQFRDYLKGRGLRLTSERLAVLEQAFAHDDHFQAEDLLVRMRQNGHPVSRATIYRTLPLLVRSGLLTEVIDAQKNSYYEHIHTRQEKHAHLICLRCSKIEEFKSPEIEALQKEVCKTYQFQAVKYRNEILGYCAECQAAGI